MSLLSVVFVFRFFLRVNFQFTAIVLSQTLDSILNTRLTEWLEEHDGCSTRTMASFRRIRPARSRCSNERRARPIAARVPLTADVALMSTASRTGEKRSPVKAVHCAGAASQRRSGRLQIDYR